jgi:hypothetical protein
VQVAIATMAMLGTAFNGFMSCRELFLFLPNTIFFKQLHE